MPPTSAAHLCRPCTSAPSSSPAALLPAACRWQRCRRRPCSRCAAQPPPGCSAQVATWRLMARCWLRCSGCLTATSSLLCEYCLPGCTAPAAAVVQLWAMPGAAVGYAWGSCGLCLGQLWAMPGAAVGYAWGSCCHTVHQGCAKWADDERAATSQPDGHMLGKAPGSSLPAASHQTSHQRTDSQARCPAACPAATRCWTARCWRP
jgi:hypothetical protein